jgi:hypothetical protein
MRKAISVSFIIIVSLFILVSAEAAPLNDFQGYWVNIDANTRGITKVDIKVSGNDVTVQAWGQCHPQDCDWGRVRGTAYASNVSSSVARDTRALTAVFTQSFKRTFVIIQPARNNQIRIESYDEFLGSDRRTNYTQSYVMKRFQVATGPLTTQPMAPFPGQSMTPSTPPSMTATPMNPPMMATPMTPSMAVKEDCVSFNPNTAEVKNISGRWKIVDGRNWLFDFAGNRAEAERTLSIIKRYRMTQSCFVGRPHPSFQYMLAFGRAPAGSYPGEDCISFNPNTTEVKNINGRWKIVDGSHWMFDFARNESEARQTLAIIKKYGFTSSCFVGRPNPSFQYMRR